MRKNKLKLTDEQKTAKKYVLQDFDFVKCAKVMHLYDWEWTDLKRSPSAKELEEVASNLIDSLFFNDSKSIATGGLVAKIINEEGNKILRLEFVLESGQGGRYL